MTSADRVVFSTDSVTIGAFRCAVDHPSFRDSGPIRDDCFVFPRTAVVIEHDDARAFVADPTMVTLYNRQQRYERRAVGAEGDRCDWFAVSRDLLLGAVRDRDPEAAADARPIRFSHAPADAATYLAQRQLFLEAASIDDPLLVEERVLVLLDRVLTLAYRSRRTNRPAVHLRHAPDLADAAKRWMEPRIGQRLTLTRIAGALGCSAFHLCRSFRRATGMALHAYRDAVRVRRALERLEEGERDLTRLALDLGYSSHSHFTAAFRRSFATPPSAARKLLIVRS